MSVYLDFEKSLEELETKIGELKRLSDGQDLDIASEIRRLPMMARNVSRRRFLRAGAAVAATTVAATAASTSLAQGDQEPRKLTIIAVACSPRAGKTTAQALQVCVEAAKAVDPEHIEVEWIELAGLKIPAHVAVGLPLEPGEKDDFPAVAGKLGAANVAGIIIGSPVYFCNMSALCKAFLDRCFSFRARKFALANKVAGRSRFASAMPPSPMPNRFRNARRDRCPPSRQRSMISRLFRCRTIIKHQPNSKGEVIAP